MPMLTLHYLQYSQAIRVLWLLEELAANEDGSLASDATSLSHNYHLKLYERLPDLQAPPELKAISPLGTSPVVIIPSSESRNDIGDSTDDCIILAESNAILDYILNVEGHPDESRPLRLSKISTADERRKLANYLFWFHTGPCSFQHALQTDTLLRVVPTKVPWPLSYLVQVVCTKTAQSYVVPRVTAILEAAEKQLSQSDYFAGTTHLTLADIANVYSVESALTRYPRFQTTFPLVHAWWKRIKARTALQRALEKAGQIDGRIVASIAT